MNRKNQRVAVLVVVVGLFAGACVADDVGYAEAEMWALSPNGISLNGISLNALSPNGLASNHLMTDDLANAALGQGAGLSIQGGEAVRALLETDYGKELFAYIVSCALPAANSITANVSGTQYQFAGGLGLAPAWTTRGINESERRWVSACLLARSNAYGISVQVSLRGNEALTPTAAERAEYQVLEGAFYGNVFVDHPSKLEMVACRGRDQAAGEFGSLVNRDCAEPAGNGLTVCGMKYAGDCLDFTPDSPGLHACAASIDGNYTDCNRNASVATRTGLGAREVVTTYVKN